MIEIPNTEESSTTNVQLRTATPTFLATIDSLPSETPIRATYTPLPTLQPNQAEALAEELFANNGGCKLPCWWGITPGKSFWDSTFQYLSTFASEIVLLGVGVDGVKYFHTNYRYLNLGLNNTVYFDVNNNIVDNITVEPDYDNKVFQLHLHQLLTSYGKPTEINIYLRRQITHPGEENFYPFMLVLSYPDQNIIAFYIYKGFARDNIVYACLPQEVLPELLLWSPTSSLDVTNILRGTVDEKYAEDDSRPLPALEDFTNMSIDEFYDAFVDSDSTTCLETPESSWVGDARP